MQAALSGYRRDRSQHDRRESKGQIYSVRYDAVDAAAQRVLQGAQEGRRTSEYNRRAAETNRSAKCDCAESERASRAKRTCCANSSERRTEVPSVTPSAAPPTSG